MGAGVVAPSFVAPCQSTSSLQGECASVSLLDHSVVITPLMSVHMCKCGQIYSTIACVLLYNSNCFLQNINNLSLVEDDSLQG
jgi:hypothetical protein